MKSLAGVWKWNWELQLGWTEIQGPNKSTTLHGNTYHSKRSLCFHFPKFSIQRLCFNLFPFPKQTLQRTLSSLIAEQKHHSLLYSSVSLTLSWPWGCDCCCVTAASACRLLLPQLSPQGYPTMGKAAQLLDITQWWDGFLLHLQMGCVVNYFSETGTPKVGGKPSVIARHKNPPCRHKIAHSNRNTVSVPGYTGSWCPIFKIPYLVF